MKKRFREQNANSGFCEVCKFKFLYQDVIIDLHSKCHLKHAQNLRYAMYHIACLPKRLKKEYEIEKTIEILEK